MTSWAADQRALEPTPDSPPAWRLPPGVGSSAAVSEPSGDPVVAAVSVGLTAERAQASGIAALPIRRPGDVFGQAGWEPREWIRHAPLHQAPSRQWAPFIALLLVAALLTLLLVVFAAHGHPTAGYTWDDIAAAVA